MATQLIVGTTTFTADEAGSPTISNTLLLWPEEGVTPNATLDSFEQKFFIQILETTRAALKARLDETRAVLNDAQYADVVIEYTAGSSVIELRTSDNTWQEVRIDVVEHLGQTTALLECTIKASRPGAPSSGGGAPAFEPIAAQWEIEENVSGLGAMIGILTFRSKAEVIGYWDNLRNGVTTAYPPWLATRFRQVSAATAMQQNPTGVAIVDDDFKESTLIVTYKELYATFAANPAFLDVKDVLSNLGTAPRELDKRSGQLAGDDMTLTGRIDFRIAQNQEFDPNSPAGIAVATLRAKAKNVIDALVSEAQLRYGDGGLFVRYVQLHPDTIEGRIGFTVLMTQATVKVLNWEETTRLRSIDRDSEDYDADGTVTIFEHPAGPEHYVTWDITTVALGAPREIPTPPGVSGANWKRLNYERQPAKNIGIGGDTSNPDEFVYRAAGEWKWQGPGQEDHPSVNDRETIADRG